MIRYFFSLAIEQRNRAAVRSSAGRKAEEGGEVGDDILPLHFLFLFPFPFASLFSIFSHFTY